MKKIFVDCSYLYDHKELNTGIQRVVRRIIENLEIISKEEKNFEVIPVNISNNQFFRVDIQNLYNKNIINSAEEIKKVDYKRVFKNYLKNIYNALRGLIAAVFPHQRVRDFLYARRDSFGLSFIIDKTVIKPIKFFITKKPKDSTNDNSLSVNKGDTLLLLDSTWYLNIWPTVSKAKQDGARIVSVIYDLIPITHSQFCDDFLAKVFKDWFKESLRYVDGYIAISNTVKNDLISYLSIDFSEEIKTKKFDYFLLGSDFSYKNMKNLPIRDSLKDCQGKSTYLTVCTIEPRKNHKYLLDVFDILWEKGIDVNLCFVGRIGWKVEDLMHRITNHPMLNKRLFIWSDLNDEELKFCYKNSKMLLFPSVAEGFGLPIVESLSNHLPVLASDIPVHREIGQDKIGYFDINDVNDLVNKLIKIEKDGIPKELIPDSDYKWISWYESSKMLLEKVMRMDKE